MADGAGSGTEAESTAARRRYSFTATERDTRAAPSRVLWVLKFVLPATAAILIAVLFAWPQFEKADTEVSKALPEEAGDLQMRNARYAGTDARNRPFTVSAEATRQAGEDRVALDKPQADITLENGTWVAAVASHGLFDRHAKTLNLSGDVQLFHDQGYQVRSESVRVDLDSGTAVGDQGVVAQGPAGTLTGEGFRIEDDGNRIAVNGRSQLTLNPSALPRKP